MLLHQGMAHSPEVLARVLEMLAADAWATTLPVEWLNPAPCAATGPPDVC